MTTLAVLFPTTVKLGRVATLGYHQPQAWQIVTRMVSEVPGSNLTAQLAGDQPLPTSGM